MLVAMDFSVQVLVRGDHRLVYLVTGLVECPTPSYALTLRPTNEGIWDDPKIAALELSAAAPTGIIPEVITSVPVYYAGTDRVELETVGVRLTGDLQTENGERQILLPVPADVARLYQPAG